MRVKRFLLLIPIGLTVFLVQSYFWVPTYEKQAKGNPQRLLKYIHGSAADAQILNPILSADTTSSSINTLVFEGLIDLDDELNYRPRLAASWNQYEVAWLILHPQAAAFHASADAESQAQKLWQSMAGNRDWRDNVASWEVVPPETRNGSVYVPVVDGEGRVVKENGRPKMREVAYKVKVPARMKFVLKKIDQDFFNPVRDLLGNSYFESFPYPQFVGTDDPEGIEVLKSQFDEILPVAEHNPVIEFDLRKGVRFHDGHEFDSGDVLFTYHSIMNPRNASPRTSDYEPVKSAEALGPHRVRFIYKRLFSPAINSWFMGIIPEHLLNEDILQEEARERKLDPKTFTMRDSRFGRSPVGTGPFIFQQWQSDELIRLTRNDDYWEGPPEYHEYVMRIVPDSLTQEMEFYAGAVDNYSVQPHQVARFKQEERFQEFSSLGYFFAYIGYNMRNPLFASPQVRTALGMAIDVEQIIEHVLYGEGERVTGPYPKITPWYDPAVKPIPYDPEGALKILNDLGWKKNSEGYLEKDGKIFEFNLITNSGNPIRKNILTIAQNSWRKIGIKCNTQLFEWAVFLKDFVNTLKFDALILGWSMGIDPDLFQIWHSSQTGPQQLNFVGFENEEADRLIVRIRREYDKKKQENMAHQLHRLIAGEQPYTFLYVAKSTRLLDKKIVIVEQQPDGSEKYVKIYPTKDGQITYYFNKWRKLDHVPEFAAAG